MSFSARRTPKFTCGAGLFNLPLWETVTARPVHFRSRGPGSTSGSKIQTELAGALAAVERQFDAGDEVARLADQETGQRPEIVRPAQAPQRHGGNQELLRAFGADRHLAP